MSEMSEAVSSSWESRIFTGARSHHAWLDKPVADELLEAIFDLAKWCPTSFNSMPMRVLFLKTEKERRKLIPALSGSNDQQVRAAPITAIIAYDEAFYDLLPELYPAFNAAALFASNPLLSKESAFRNSSLQGAYLMLAARALGLDVGPMSGFDNKLVDQLFFHGTHWRSNFLCNIGFADHTKLYPRGPRLNFQEVCKIV